MPILKMAIRGCFDVASRTPKPHILIRALQAREMVILGSQYAGEMKKGIFTVMHYLMPKRGILSLHSGCNVGKDNDVSLFFGLSGARRAITRAEDSFLLLCCADNHISAISLRACTRRRMLYIV